MVRFTKVLALCLTAFLSIFAHCHHDDMGDYVVDINIVKPTTNQGFTIGQSLSLDINLRRNDGSTIHNVAVEVINQADNSKTVVIDRHFHQSGTISIVDSSYVLTKAGNFTLNVRSTDDDKAQPNTATVNFKVN